MTLTLGLNTMSPAVNFGPWGSGPAPNLKMVKHAEALGFDTVWTSEASGTDAVSPIAYIAGQTSTIKVGTNIMQMAGRSPATTAMTAVTLDSLSGGRFVLGLGVSGPAVVEGWHSMRYGKPISRSREYITIVREIVARKKPLEFHGEYFDIPYQGEGATGLARPIKLMVRPRRPRIPLYLAAMGPMNLRLAMDTCDGVLPVAWAPDRESIFFDGTRSREEIDAVRQDAGLGPLQIAPFVPCIMGDDVAACHDQLRATFAFWLGAMGPKEANFYNRLACRAGYEEAVTRVQALYVDGHKTEAARAVPTALMDEVSLCGPRERIRDRLEAWQESSVTTMIICGLTKPAMETLAELVL